MPSWLPEAVVITLITVFVNLVSIVYQRRTPPAKDRVDTQKTEAETDHQVAQTAQILINGSGSLVQGLLSKVAELESALKTVRDENIRTVDRLEERIALVNQQYTDYVLATDVRIDELERENAEIKRENLQIKRENRELRKRIAQFIDNQECVNCE